MRGLDGDEWGRGAQSGGQPVGSPDPEKPSGSCFMSTMLLLNLLSPK